jgi:hypothetical protein
MTRKPFRQHVLADGTSLAERPDGDFTWHPEQRVVSVSIADGIATLATTDDPPERLGEFELANGKPAADAGPSSIQPGAPPGGSATELRAPTPGRSDDAKRWATLNEFEDLVARHLTLAEQGVWHHLFRWCRDGKSSVSTRGIATNLGVAPNTVTAALRWLKDRGLIWEIAKSTNKGSASLYGVHPRPGQFVHLCETANRPRLSERKREPPRQRKPR